MTEKRRFMNFFIELTVLMYILWKRCNKQGISEFFESFFGHCDIDLGNVKDDVWTPAEVANICISHRDDFKLASKKICERTEK